MCTLSDRIPPSAKPTHPGKRSYEVVNVDVGLLCVDVRSNLKEVLLNRGNISELEQSQCMSREISGGSHTFSKATVFLKQDKQALSMMGPVEKRGTVFHEGTLGIATCSIPRRWETLG